MVVDGGLYFARRAAVHPDHIHAAVFFGNVFNEGDIVRIVEPFIACSNPASDITCPDRRGKRPVGGLQPGSDPEGDIDLLPCYS